jgi:hypothetical protein
MRARYPDREGYVESHGVPIYWETHFEQNVHVPHRLARYGAGTRMEYHRTEPDALAAAIADGLKRPVLYRDVETDGARRAAASIATLL